MKLDDLTVNVKIDKLCLSSSNNGKEVFPDYDRVPGYRFHKCFDPRDLPEDLCNRDSENKNQKKHYKTVAIFYHEQKGNALLVFHNRIQKHKYVPLVYVCFYTEYDQVISYQDVYEVERFFRQYCGGRLTVSIVHVAIDISTPVECDLYVMVLLAIRCGKKKISRIEDHGVYYGSLKSSDTLLVYDKSYDLERNLAKPLPVFIVRIESRFKMPKMRAIKIVTIDHLAVYQWSFLYGKFFSLHQHTDRLDEALRSIGAGPDMPIWKVVDLMEDRFGVTSSNFYRDHLRDHSLLTDPVRKALDSFRWCPEFKSYLS